MFWRSAHLAKDVIPRVKKDLVPHHNLMSARVGNVSYRWVAFFELKRHLASVCTEPITTHPPDHRFKHNDAQCPPIDGVGILCIFDHLGGEIFRRSNLSSARPDRHLQSCTPYQPPVPSLHAPSIAHSPHPYRPRAVTNPDPGRSQRGEVSARPGIRNLSKGQSRPKRSAHNC